MAELETKKGRGTPRVDLTPMVDLGFLLITFFMLTTTISKPMAMELQMPYTEPGNTVRSPVKNSTAMTILLGKDHRLYYYYGIGSDPVNPPEIKVANGKDMGSLRGAINAKKQMIQELITHGANALDATDRLTVLIKPADNSCTEDLIHILDEMSINQVPVYAVTDIAPLDLTFIETTEQQMGLAD